jgi:hypothetical protein
MRIDANSRLDAPSARRAARGDRAAGGFGRAFEVEPQARAADIVAPNIINGLLAFQEVEDATAGVRRRAWQRGADLLDRLEDLKLGILDGAYDSERLGELARLARAGRIDSTDPHLDEVLAEIELRAAVELAKLRHS